jgi:uncharacterized membrane protein
MKSPRKSDKIATYIARFIVFCIGISLLVIFVVLNFKKAVSFESWMIFGAMIGLSVGYGLGGDIWGAKLFDLFTHLNTSKAVEADKKDDRQTKFLSKVALVISIGFIVFFAAILTIAFLNRGSTH